MGWKRKAFLRGMLLGIPLIGAAMVFGIGKGSLTRIISDYGNLILAAFLFLTIWFGFANLISLAVDRSKSRKQQKT